MHLMTQHACAPLPLFLTSCLCCPPDSDVVYTAKPVWESYSRLLADDGHVTEGALPFVYDRECAGARERVWVGGWVGARVGGWVGVWVGGKRPTAAQQQLNSCLLVWQGRCQAVSPGLFPASSSPVPACLRPPACRLLCACLLTPPCLPPAVCLPAYASLSCPACLPPCVPACSHGRGLRDAAHAKRHQLPRHLGGGGQGGRGRQRGPIQVSREVERPEPPPLQHPVVPAEHPPQGEAEAEAPPPLRWRRRQRGGRFSLLCGCVLTAFPPGPLPTPPRPTPPPPAPLRRLSGTRRRTTAPPSFEACCPAL